MRAGARPPHRRGPSVVQSTIRRLGLLGRDRRDAVQSLVALGLLALASVFAGLTLGANTGRLEELPGLLLMVPAAIALRGNIFGAMGSRLGTAIHAGTFRPSLRPTTVVGENLLASLVLTLASSLLLAVLAKGTAVAFGVADSISMVDFVVISMVGGLLSSVAVVVVALALAAGSVRYGWDPDNVTAPLVTATGDVATVPALIAASLLLRGSAIAAVIASVLALATVALTFVVMRRARRSLRVILNESMPVLAAAVLLDLLAGITVEKQLDQFVDLPALLVLLPAYLAGAGAIGGILSSRLSSKLHLGTMAATGLPGRAARPDLAAAMLLAVPVFVVSAMLAQLVSTVFEQAGPGLVDLLAVALIGGLVAVVVAICVAYYGTIVAVRSGLDPDTYGIPLVTSVLDLAGAFTFVVAVEAIGLT